MRAKKITEETVAEFDAIPVKFGVHETRCYVDSLPWIRIACAIAAKDHGALRTAVRKMLRQEDGDAEAIHTVEMLGSVAAHLSDVARVVEAAHVRMLLSVAVVAPKDSAIDFRELGKTLPEAGGKARRIAQ